MATRFFNNTIVIKTGKPLISFSFDDAPRTSFTVGAELLNQNGVKGTFFVSLGLLGCEAPGGTIAYSEDILRAARDGHELGCHTYDHLDAWGTAASEFRASILRNRQGVRALLPDAEFRSFAYPISDPSPMNKRCAGALFRSCRGGGQRANGGRIDLNLLQAYFLDGRNRQDLRSIRSVIDRNAESGGWLIFATHDVTENPSGYGCTPEQLKTLIDHSLKSGAEILSIATGVERIRQAARGTGG
jgi:peptidoglycan/xylan/chitin deacetylase (PgdA/CDA1 family)